MTYHLEGRLLEVCDCRVLCPCWIGEDPDNGTCETILAYKMKKGTINGTDVTGLSLALMAHGRFPNPGPARPPRRRQELREPRPGACLEPRPEAGGERGRPEQCQPSSSVARHHRWLPTQSTGQQPQRDRVASPPSGPIPRPQPPPGLMPPRHSSPKAQRTCR